MSGIYIPNMEKSTNCCDCPLSYENGWCPARKTWVDKYSYEICPLIPVPDHGRLGDLDALHKLFIEKAKEYKGIGGAMVGMAALCIAKAPTIIPADKEVEG